MSLLNKFIGTARWQSLFAAIDQESSTPREPGVGTAAAICALLLGIVPVFLTFAYALNLNTSSKLPTLGFGICAVLGIVLRWRLKLPFFRTLNWARSLSLTHTAVALGCIPAVAVLIFAPDLLAQRHDVLTEAVQMGSQPEAPRPSLSYVLGLVVMMAMWVAVVEEVIFRGVLVSVLRRWKGIKSQRNRDIFAAVVSALIFGTAHYATWGPIASVALIGLGLGFVIAYIANGEQILPLIMYHFVFDLLSISVSIFG